MSRSINLAELPDPDVIETLDLEAIIQANKDHLISLHPASSQADVQRVLALESEPLTKFIELLSYREMLLRARYNDEARALLLAKAKGSNLDHIAYTYYRREIRLVVVEADPDSDPAVEEVLEDDEEFRNRVALKPESYSVAGPTQAFIFHALSASGQVKSATATSPQPGTSLVTVLSKEGDGTPAQALLDTVFSALNTDEVRPQSEEVVVQAAEILNYGLGVEIFIYPGPDNALVVSNALANLQAYTKAAHVLDENISLSALEKAAHQPGVQHVNIVVTGTAMADNQILVSKLQAAYCTGIAITARTAAP
ncbi:baseplate assembly protein [Methylobacillus glycogenes]|uniref:baseplate assembly protein n=1 Tax=Methylobacillus glycogenes TaxID=406 RepID=UPI00046F5B05|nr:baseplate J/gp47 family protein [Methylobacillus glycogenes]